MRSRRSAHSGSRSRYGSRSGSRCRFRRRRRSRFRSRSRRGGPTRGTLAARRTLAARAGLARGCQIRWFQPILIAQRGRPGGRSLTIRPGTLGRFRRGSGNLSPHQNNPGKQKKNSQKPDSRLTKRNVSALYATPAVRKKSGHGETPKSVLKNHPDIEHIRPAGNTGHNYG